MNILFFVKGKNNRKTTIVMNNNTKGYNLCLKEAKSISHW